MALCEDLVGFFSRKKLYEVNMMRALIITVAGLCSALTLLWAVLKPGFDSCGAFLAAFVVFLSSFKIPKNEGNSQILMKKQNVSEDSIGLQADTIQDVKINKK